MPIQPLIQPEQIDFLPLNRLASSGATANQFARFDGTAWQPASLPVVSGSQAGILPALPNNAGQVLCGDGVWRAVSGGVGGVTSFNGRTGAVSPQASDYAGFYLPANHQYFASGGNITGSIGPGNTFSLTAPVALPNMNIQFNGVTQAVSPSINFTGNVSVVGNTVNILGSSGGSTNSLNVSNWGALIAPATTNLDFHGNGVSVLPLGGGLTRITINGGAGQYTQSGGNVSGTIGPGNTFTLNATGGGVMVGALGAGVRVLPETATPQSAIFAKTLVAGANVTLTDTGTEIYIAASASGGGVGGVSSFNGRTGAVSPQASDYSAFYLPANHQYTASGGNITGTIGPGNTFTLFGAVSGSNNINLQWNGITQTSTNTINFTGNVSVIGNTVNIPTGSGGGGGISGISINGAGSYTNIQFNTSHFDVFGNLIQLRNVAGGVTQVTSGLPSVLSVTPTSGNVVVTPVGISLTSMPFLTGNILSIPSYTLQGGIVSGSTLVQIPLPTSGGGGLIGNSGNGLTVTPNSVALGLASYTGPGAMPMLTLDSHAYLAGDGTWKRAVTTINSRFGAVSVDGQNGITVNNSVNGIVIGQNISAMALYSDGTGQGGTIWELTKGITFSGELGVYVRTSILPNGRLLVRLSLQPIS